MGPTKRSVFALLVFPGHCARWRSAWQLMSHFWLPEARFDLFQIGKVTLQGNLLIACHEQEPSFSK
jgi:hypothetical protein